MRPVEAFAKALVWGSIGLFVASLAMPAFKYHFYSGGSPGAMTPHVWGGFGLFGSYSEMLRVRDLVTGLDCFLGALLTTPWIFLVNPILWAAWFAAYRGVRSSILLSGFGMFLAAWMLQKNSAPPNVMHLGAYVWLASFGLTVLVGVILCVDAWASKRRMAVMPLAGRSLDDEPSVST